MITFTRLGRMGRLGNQMWQYAALLGIAERLGLVAKIPPRRQIDLARVFKLTLPSYRRFERLLVVRSFDETYVGYSERYRSIRNWTDISGYFQSIRYFGDHARLCREYEFLSEIEREASMLVSVLRQNREDRPLLGMTVRHGKDILNNELRAPLWETDYYERAVVHFGSLRPNLVIATDDGELCRQRFPGTTVLDRQEPEVQLCFLSKCDHLITTNSTFAWWAGWLNNVPGRIVIAPKNWYRTGARFTEADRDPHLPGWELL